MALMLALLPLASLFGWLVDRSIGKTQREKTMPQGVMKRHVLIKESSFPLAQQSTNYKATMSSSCVVMFSHMQAARGRRLVKQICSKAAAAWSAANSLDAQ